MGPKQKTQCAGGMIPQHLRHELTSTGKKQRNTQAGLLAIWCLILCSAKHISGHTLYIADDSTGTVSNILAGSSASPDSRAIVGNIWILAASLDIEIYVQHIPGCLNPGDPFSRPEEPEKVKEAAHIIQETSATQVNMVWPATLRTDPKSWVQTIKAARIQKQKIPAPGLNTEGTATQAACLMHSTDTNSIAKLIVQNWPTKRVCMGTGNESTMATARTYSKAAAELVKAMRGRYENSPVDKIIVQHAPNVPTIRATSVLLHVKDKFAQGQATASTPESVEEDGHFVVTFTV